MQQQETFFNIPTSQNRDFLRILKLKVTNFRTMAGTVKKSEELSASQNKISRLSVLNLLLIYY